MWSMFNTHEDADDEEATTLTEDYSEISPITANLTAPPKPRVVPGFVGLLNQGATCYMNSLLQAHFMTPEFRNFIFSFKPKEQLGVSRCSWITKGDVDALKAFKDEKNSKRAQGSRLLLLQLQRLFTELLKLNIHSRSTSNLTEIGFQWTGKDGRVQHDAQDLNSHMMDWIEQSVGDICNSETGQISDIYEYAQKKILVVMAYFTLIYLLRTLICVLL